MTNLLMPVIGWSGVVFCTLGYLLLSLKTIRADSLPFQLLNIAVWDLIGNYPLRNKKRANLMISPFFMP